jgi:competence protein ComGC
MAAHKARATTQLKRRFTMQMLVYIFEVLIVLAVITVLLLVFFIGV